MAETVPDEDNPMFLKKPKKEPKYVQGELFPLEKESLTDKAKRWWDNLPVRPYVKIRDSNNDSNTPFENRPKPGYEIGIRISF